MNIQIFELIEGAKKATGITVIIDVFRAFSLECYLYGRGVNTIFPIGDLQEAYALKKEHPDWILIGERGGKKSEGCDYGNSPSQTEYAPLKGRTIIHTTSAGTQGIINAVNADIILAGSLVNAHATASYIKSMNPEKVSLVAMGNGGIRTAREDVICAEYIRSLLLDEPYPIEECIASLRENGGAHFFHPDTQDVFPKEDFELCIKYDLFPFLLQAEKNSANQTVIKRNLQV